MSMRKTNIRNTKTKSEIRWNTTDSRESIIDLEQIFVFNCYEQYELLYFIYCPGI